MSKSILSLCVNLHLSFYENNMKLLCNKTNPVVMESGGKQMSKIQKFFIWFLGILLVLVTAVTVVLAKVYFDVKGSMNETFEQVEDKRVDTGVKRQEKLDLSEQQPFSVLLLGVDTGDLGRTEQGRSDTMMLATVNPQNKETVITSIPRDTYMEIVGYGTIDKINHAYAFGGPAMSMDSLEKFLNIPIDHYVSINMQGVKDLVNAVGGVDVNNDLEFDIDGHHFPLGPIHLNGEEALAFSRMRYEDPRGDYGRQKRQRDVVAAVAKKALSLDGVTQYQAVLDAVSANMSTDLDFGSMQKIALNYRDAFGNISNDQLKGDGAMIDGVSYQIVSDEELTRVQSELQRQLGMN